MIARGGVASRPPLNGVRARTRCWLRRVAAAALLASVTVPGAAAQSDVAAPARAAGSKAEQLLAEIQKIMRSTDFTNEAAANAAEAKIKALTEAYEKEMTKGGVLPGASAPGAAASKRPVDPTQPVLSAGSADLNALIEKGVAAGDEFGDFLMAEPVKAQIRAEYKQLRDEEPVPGSLPNLEVPIIIDVAAPEARQQVSQLSKNTKSTVLVITSSRPGQGLDPATVLAAASRMPLRELSLIHQRSRVTVLPSAVLGFASLERLSLYDNALAALPAGIGGLRMLRRLDLDLNPIATLPASLSQLRRLRDLNLVKTGVDSAEHRRLRAALPSCTVRIQ